MSEFQQYQFQVVDRPLTIAEQDEVSSWSSRSSASSTAITFTYHYSDFPKNEESVMEKYFDAMFYVANWGAKRLMFRFPRNIINEEAIKKYTIVPEYASSYLDFYTYSEYVILDFSYSNEGGGEWIGDDEYQLGDYLPLREQIINGDYRCLKMAWLKVVDEIQEEDYEAGELVEHLNPPVPAGLNDLNASLSAFQETFEIYDEILVDSIAKSKDLVQKEMDYSSLISKLSQKEKNEFLIRLINGESRLDLKLKRRLQNL